MIVTSPLSDSRRDRAVAVGVRADRERHGAVVALGVDLVGDGAVVGDHDVDRAVVRGGDHVVGRVEELEPHATVVGCRLRA